jgi:hypothetical protein
MKFDEFKPRMELLPWEALEFVAWVLTYGAEKYDDDNWRDLPNAEKRLMGAALRHIAKDQAGKRLNTDERDLPHLAQAACNILMLLWFRRDDYPRGYNFKGVREEFEEQRRKAQDGMDTGTDVRPPVGLDGDAGS